MKSKTGLVLSNLGYFFNGKNEPLILICDEINAQDSIWNEHFNDILEEREISSGSSTCLGEYTEYRKEKLAGNTIQNILYHIYLLQRRILKMR